MASEVRSGVPWAGLLTGPGAWVVSTQMNYALVPWVCAHVNVIPFTTLALAIVALAGAVLSWLAWRATGGFARFWERQDGIPRNFLAGVSVLLGLLFALVILMQGTAGLVLQGCER